MANEYVNIPSVLQNESNNRSNTYSEVQSLDLDNRNEFSVSISRMEDSSTFYFTSDTELICTGTITRREDPNYRLEPKLIEIRNKAGEKIFELSRSFAYSNHCIFCKSVELSIRTETRLDYGKVKKKTWSNNYTIYNYGSPHLTLKREGSFANSFKVYNKQQVVVGTIIREEEYFSIKFEDKATSADKNLALCSIFLVDFLISASPADIGDIEQNQRPPAICFPWCCFVF